MSSMVFRLLIPKDQQERFQCYRYLATPYLPGSRMKFPGRPTLTAAAPELRADLHACYGRSSGLLSPHTSTPRQQHIARRRTHTTPQAPHGTETTLVASKTGENKRKMKDMRGYRRYQGGVFS